MGVPVLATVNVSQALTGNQDPNTGVVLSLICSLGIEETWGPNLFLKHFPAVVEVHLNTCFLSTRVQGDFGSNDDVLIIGFFAVVTCSFSAQELNET